MVEDDDNDDDDEIQLPDPVPEAIPPTWLDTNEDDDEEEVREMENTDLDPDPNYVANLGTSASAATSAENASAPAQQNEPTENASAPAQQIEPTRANRPAPTFQPQVRSEGHQKICSIVLPVLLSVLQEEAYAQKQPRDQVREALWRHFPCGGHIIVCCMFHL